MVVVVERLVERLDAFDEHLLLPFLSSTLRIRVVIEEHSQLHASGEDLTLGAVVSLWHLAASVTKDGISEHRCSKSVEASSLLAVERLRAGGKLFDSVVIVAV